MAATASRFQAAFLRDLIYKHLAYRALIGVHIPSLGYPTFDLEFHLPYYAWRWMRPILEDHRQRADGKPLRRSEEVIYLEMKNQSPNTDDDLDDCIYEAQLSVMITGIDDWLWTAYCFVDVYFKGERHKEQVEHYSNPNMRLDLHSCGKYSADRPVWLPRAYFLRTLSCRMEQVKQEWNNVVFRLFQQIEPYVCLRSSNKLSPKKDLC